MYRMIGAEVVRCAVFPEGATACVRVDCPLAVVLVVTKSLWPFWVLQPGTAYFVPILLDISGV